jgi:hypothetical protein
MAIGAAVWGALAFGLVTTSLVAAAPRHLAIPGTTLDRSLSVHWPAPTLMVEPSEDDGPVLVRS